MTPKPVRVWNEPSPLNWKFRASPPIVRPPTVTCAPTESNETSASFAAAPVSIAKFFAGSVSTEPSVMFIVSARNLKAEILPFENSSVARTASVSLSLGLSAIVAETERRRRAVLTGPVSDVEVAEVEAVAADDEAGRALLARRQVAAQADGRERDVRGDDPQELLRAVRVRVVLHVDARRGDRDDVRDDDVQRGGLDAELAGHAEGCEQRRRVRDRRERLLHVDLDVEGDQEAGDRRRDAVLRQACGLRAIRAGRAEGEAG